MRKDKRFWIMVLALVCIVIAVGAILISNNPANTDTSENENITVNDSIADVINPDDNGTVWLEENGTLKETEVSQSSGNGSASS